MQAGCIRRQQLECPPAPTGAQKRGALQHSNRAAACRRAAAAASRAMASAPGTAPHPSFRPARPRMWPRIESGSPSKWSRRTAGLESILRALARVFSGPESESERARLTAGCWEGGSDRGNQGTRLITKAAAHAAAWAASWKVKLKLASPIEGFPGAACAFLNGARNALLAWGRHQSSQVPQQSVWRAALGRVGAAGVAGTPCICHCQEGAVRAAVVVSLKFLFNSRCVFVAWVAGVPPSSAQAGEDVRASKLSQSGTVPLPLPLHTCHT